MLRYDISPLDPEAHLFIVGITISNPTPQSQYLRLPNWISGSYLIRDFAGTIQCEEARLGDISVPIEKVDKCTWRVPTVGIQPDQKLFIYYQVWAFDNSPRTAYLDDTRGYFNPGAVFMEVLGNTEPTIQVHVTPPDAQDDALHENLHGWKVATGLSPATTTPPYGWGLYEASSYAELIDHPFEMGDFETLSFTACGVDHRIVLNDTPINFDAPRFLRDLQAICETEIRFFDPENQKAPFSQYTFLINVMSSNYGGLEHRNSCSLIAPAKTFPSLAQPELTKDYATLLTLCAHEYFHAWNVKRIQPAEFIDIDFNEEVTTELLWLFEGFTSYYDNLLSHRAGVIDTNRYAQLLSDDLKSVIESSGRDIQTLSQSSFDAWIKFYKPNANRPNATVSYYRQGALAALTLDSAIRRKTQGKKSLDDVMRRLWADYIDSQDNYAGITPDSFCDTVIDATGCDFTELIEQLTKTTVSIDYGIAWKPLGIRLEETPVKRIRAMLGIDGKGTDAGYVVRTVYDHEVAQWVGIAPGDTLIAIDSIRVNATNLEELLSRYREGDQMVVHAFRDDKLRAWVVLSGQKAPVASTVSLKKLTPLGKAWLNA